MSSPSVEGVRVDSALAGVAAGRAARRRVPLAALAEWHSPAVRPDPIAILETQARSLVPELVSVRYRRMLDSPASFFRGAAAIMASDLDMTADAGLEVQLCGDAHSGNFGVFRFADGSAVFDVMDFDETFAGPWEWDIKRLASSLELDARELGLSAQARRDLICSVARAYQSAMVDFARRDYMSVWYAQLHGSGLARRWTTELTRMAVTSRDLGDGRITLASRLRDVERLEHLHDEESAHFSRQVLTYMHRYEQSLGAQERQILEHFSLIDTARSVIGVSGVGHRTNIVALSSGNSNVPLLLQFKDAGESVLAPFRRRETHRHEGRRIVEGQRMTQVSNDVLLGWLRGEGVYGASLDLYVRQFPNQWTLGLRANSPPRELGLLGRAAAWTLAHGHARTGDRLAIATYVGSGTRFADFVADFAARYADQSSADYRDFVDAVNRRRIIALTATQDTAT